MSPPSRPLTGTTVIRDYLAVGGLSDLLGDESSTGFDRLARLAARAFGAASASVTLFDGEHTWATGGFGPVSPAGAVGSVLAVHAARAADVVVVDDVAADARFAHGSLVGDAPSIRFFAGAPLVVEHGRPIGSLCVFDVVPREGATDVQIELLRDLAAVVVDEIAHHVRHRALIEAQAEAGRLATTDPLTGLSNRRKLDDTLDNAIALARRTKHALAVLMLDLDGFKSVNDRYGHDLGDDVLVEMAGRLTRGVREHDLVARMGGDEFVVVLQAVDRAAVAEAAGRLHEALTRQIEAEEVPGLSQEGVRMRVSVGVALFPVDGEDMTSLLRAADLAMYEAKASGGGVRRYTVR